MKKRIYEVQLAITVSYQNKEKMQNSSWLVKLGNVQAPTASYRDVAGLTYSFHKTRYKRSKYVLRGLNL